MRPVRTNTIANIVPLHKYKKQKRKKKFHIHKNMNAQTEKEKRLMVVSGACAPKPIYSHGAYDIRQTLSTHIHF